MAKANKGEWGKGKWGKGNWGKGEGKHGKGVGRDSNRTVTSKDSLFHFFILQILSPTE